MFFYGIKFVECPMFIGVLSRFTEVFSFVSVDRSY
jgi:hypothetical protein